jgi:hypothetical protein
MVLLATPHMVLLVTSMTTVTSGGAILRGLLPPVLDQQTQLEGTHGRLGAVRDPELRDDAAQVLFDGAHAEAEGTSDLQVCVALRSHLQHLHLARRKRQG